MSSTWKSAIPVIAIVSAINFINMVAFVLVMPMGPDFSNALDMPIEMIGIVAGIFTLTSSITSLMTAPILDRFVKHELLFYLVLGFSVAMMLTGFAWNVNSLLFFRALAGVFGGPMSAIAIAYLTDATPEYFRGRAFAIVMAMFSIASIVGVPIGLELALRYTWSTPFFVIGACGVFVAVLTFIVGRYYARQHIKTQIKNPRFGYQMAFQNCVYRLAFMGNFLVFFAAFLLIPHISSYMQLMLNVPREEISMLYFWAGLVTLFSINLTGWLIDKLSVIPILTFASILLSFTVYSGYARTDLWSPLMLFIATMVLMSIRSISAQTFSSVIPQPDHRSGFMAINTAMQHFSVAVGAAMSSWILSKSTDEKMVGMPELSYLSMVLMLCIPPLFTLIQWRHQRMKLQINREKAEGIKP
ncbi:MFS transporter [Algicola sagamiensis]|uniref:MFS transporter n=1 Tax=Algicola sagamiensis TaxID=163869 RepID=UPI00146CD92B|nr:MFS transporter [Algicola sagamiensis]